MRWTPSNFITSVHGMLGGTASDSARAVNRIEAIRGQMLSCLGESGCANFPVLERRVALVADVKGLWYLRPELMNALAAVHGESAARSQIGALTDMFEGLLPSGFYSRPSTLGQ